MPVFLFIFTYLFSFLNCYGSDNTDAFLQGMLILISVTHMVKKNGKAYLVHSRETYSVYKFI